MIGVSVMEKIFVVIPNWNGADMIAASLQSLQDQTLKHHIVVVDNGSMDESVSIIKSQFPSVTLIKLSKNTGFAGGVNTGIEFALEQNTDAVALFNNDAVADKNWLASLVSVMDQNADVGIVTGKLLRTDKIHLDSTGEQYSTWAMPFPRGRNQKDIGKFDDKTEIFAATGGASLYRTAMLKEIGLFDERFFAYLEDIDISFRARLANWRVVYAPTALAYHHVSATTSKLGSFSRYHFVKNFYMTYFKNMPGILFWKYLPLFILQSLRLAASSFIKGHGWTYLQSFSRAMLNLPGILKDRHTIQKKRKVSVSSIDAMLYKHRPPKIPRLS